jgi:hypothetical protein
VIGVFARLVSVVTGYSTAPTHQPPRAQSAIRAIATVVLLEALRGRMLWLMLALLLGGFALAQYTAQIAITESAQIASGVFASWLRTTSVFVVALFVLGSMLRDWSDKGMELVLALALPRAVYLGGRLAGYAVVALVCASMCTLALMIFIDWPQALIWGATLALELQLVAALSVLCLLTLTHVTIGMSAVAAFYLLARSMDAIRLIGANPLAGAHSDAHGLMVAVLDAMAFVLPDLARFARSEWAIYGNATLADLGYAVGQCAIYLTVLIAAAMFDLQRKVL